MSRMTARPKRQKAEKKESAGARREKTSAADTPLPGTPGHISLALDMLESVYGHESRPPDIYATGEPLDGLILTLLSQNTNDRNRDTAYDSLRAKYPRWGDAALASEPEIAAAIKSAGLGETKAGRMLEILAKIKSDFGDYSLAGIKSWNATSVRGYLSNMRGIGPKTVACVMVFDLGLPAFPVDTHVARISRRLGWASVKATPEKIQDFLESEVPAARCGGGHLNMIEHGRKVCRARGQDCGGCALGDICPSRGAL